MAKYTSRYAELGFYVNGDAKRFFNGEYATADAAEIAVLDTLADATRVDGPAVAAEETTEESAAAPKAKRSTRASAQ